MSEIRRFNVRTNGRDLSAVRRPATVKVEKPKAKALPKAKGTKPASNSGTVKVSDG